METNETVYCLLFAILRPFGKQMKQGKGNTVKKFWKKKIYKNEETKSRVKNKKK